MTVDSKARNMSAFIAWIGWGLLVPVCVPCFVLALKEKSLTRALRRVDLLMYTTTLSGKTLAEWFGLPGPAGVLGRAIWSGVGIMLPVLVLFSVVAYTIAKISATPSGAEEPDAKIVSCARWILLGLTWVVTLLVRLLENS